VVFAVVLSSVYVELRWMTSHHLAFCYIVHLSQFCVVH